MTARRELMSGAAGLAAAAFSQAAFSKAALAAAQGRARVGQPWSIRGDACHVVHGPADCDEPAGPAKKRLLRMLREFPVTQPPVLPKLKRAEQDHDCAEHGMPGPEHIVAGIAKDQR